MKKLKFLLNMHEITRFKDERNRPSETKSQQNKIKYKTNMDTEIAWDVVNMYESVSRCTAHIMHRIPQSA